MTLMKTSPNSKISLFFPLQIKHFCKSQDLFWAGMMWGLGGWGFGGDAQTIIPEAFRILESISGKGGGKGAQPLWVKGFRSCFNLLADIRTVGQKSWSGIGTRIRLLNDWHFTDWQWETEGWESTCRPDLYFQTVCVFVCVFAFLKGSDVWLVYAQLCAVVSICMLGCVWMHTRVLVVMCESFIVHGNASLPVA